MGIFSGNSDLGRLGFMFIICWCYDHGASPEIPTCVECPYMCCDKPGKLRLQLKSSAADVLMRRSIGRSNFKLIKKIRDPLRSRRRSRISNKGTRSTLSPFFFFDNRRQTLKRVTVVRGPESPRYMYTCSQYNSTLPYDLVILVVSDIPQLLSND